MTKEKEPSKATMKAWWDALNTWHDTRGYVESDDKSARIIQRHVDREVRKALKVDSEIVHAAEKYVQACEAMMYERILGAREEIIAAVNAKKGRKP